LIVALVEWDSLAVDSSGRRVTCQFDVFANRKDMNLIDKILGRTRLDGDQDLERF
jgi:hypothetical protein